MAAKKNNVTKKQDDFFEKEPKKKKARIIEEDEPQVKKADKKNDASKDKRESEDKKHVPPSSKLVHQFIPFIMFVVALLIAVCLIVVELAGGDMGIVGNLASRIFCGLFGIGAFFIPIILVCLGICWHKIIDSYRAASNTVFAILSMVMLSAFIHVFWASGSFSLIDLWDIGTRPGGGGVIGGLISELLVLCFKQAGAIIITLALLIISLMFLFSITPKSIIIYCKYKSKLRRERRAEIEAEEKERITAELERRERERRAEEIRRRAKESLNEETDSGKRLRIIERDPEPETKEIPPAEPKRSPAEDPLIAIDEHLKSRERAEEEPYAEEATVVPEKKKDPEEFHEDDDGVRLREIFNDTKSKKKEEGSIISIDLPAAGTAKKSSSEPTVSVKKAEKTEEKKSDGGVVVSMKVDTEALSELESLRGDSSEESEPVVKAKYVYPSITLLKEDKNPKKDAGASDEISENAQILRETLASFNIGVKDEIRCSRGPTITRYELRPEVGVRVRSIANLIDDISLSLATSGVRIEAPIPNKPFVGIEVPNRHRQTVFLRSLIEDETFVNDPSKLTACLGADVGGNPVFFDITKMPHLLIAGATGMGKSVCINCIIMSILYKASPEEVKLILIDPKKVEFNIYKDIPHLYAPIVSDPKKAAGALASAVAEMERRFELIEDVGVREINAYNAATADDPDREYLPKMVIIIDELADLMMTAPGEVESSICRLAQKARAAGIHIIIGTQRPSVDVITGLIKANVPSRIACTVASQVDSRTIIDIAGAEKLIGRGDMLFAPVGLSKPMRVQGAFVSDNEVEAVVEFIKANNVKAEYNKEFISIMESEAAKCGNAGKKGGGSDDGGEAVDEGDPKFREAVKLAIDAGKISTSLMQRMLGVGYGRAAKIIDQMEALGYVSAPDGNKPRRVLITMQEYMEKVINDDIDVGEPTEDNEE